MTRERPVRFVHRVAYLGLRLGLGVLGALPERFAYAAMAGVARLYFACARTRRRVGLANLALAFPPQEHAWTRRERLRIVRQGTVSAFQNILDMLHGQRWRARGRLLERVDITEFSQLGIRAPFLGLSSHLGSWEAAALTAAFVEREVHVIGRVPRNPLVARHLRRQREACGLIVHDRRGGIRPLARALAEGKVALQAVDQNQRLRGVFVPFFGRLAATERSAATLAVRRGVPLVVAVCVRVAPGFRFRVRVLGPLHPVRSGALHDDVVATVRLISAAIECLVREVPDQYLWIHDRYRTRPSAGADDAGGD
ncbi:MAG: hypothetical protein IT457_03760 [Planctomycetes bacterium]|nr:hypothetical protein [Planctomycetota bacterium]